MNHLITIPSHSVTQEPVVNKTQLRWAKINEVVCNIEQGKAFTSFYDLEEVVEALMYRDIGAIKKRCASQVTKLCLVKEQQWVSVLSIDCKLNVGDDFGVHLSVDDPDGNQVAEYPLNQHLTWRDQTQGAGALHFDNQKLNFLKPICLRDGRVNLVFTGEVQIASDVNTLMELPECQR